MEALTPVGAEVFSYPPPVDIEKVVQGLCANSPTSRSLCLSPPKVGPSWTDRSWQRRNTHDQLDEGGEGLQEETFLMSSIVNFCMYISGLIIIG